MIRSLLQTVASDAPVLIAGPTASGKSSLALALAESQGGVIINADASQVYTCWNVLTARPPLADLERAPHALYGHVAHDATYSVGHWLDDAEAVMAKGARPIIVGGTGLYFSALLDGLSDIPQIPAEIRQEGNAMTLDELRTGVEPQTLTGLDQANRARVQRAWEVERATGASLRSWQNNKSTPLLSLDQACAYVLDAPKEWLTPRIEARFSAMLGQGALDEIARMEPHYDRALPAFRAIGVDECRGIYHGEMSEQEAIERATIATRQYAKRQRTWFRGRMHNWKWVEAREIR